MALKAKHAFGSEKDISKALAEGKIDAYDILFLDEKKVGWVTKSGDVVIAEPDLSEVEAELATKASAEDVEALEAEVATKATAEDIQAVENAIATKADAEKVESLEEQVAAKADAAEVETKLAEKADAEKVEALETELATKVTAEEVDAKVETAVAEKVESAVKAEVEATVETAVEAAVEAKVETAVEAAVKEEVEAAVEKTAEKTKYEITDVPVGTLVDYRDSEIRICCPENSVFTKQNVGAGGDPNSYYCTFKTFAPSDDAVGYIEHLNGQADKEILTSFNVDKENGRRYQPTWLALAVYDESAGTWNYYGNSSSKNRYIGYDYRIDWYNADGVMIASDSVRINLSNENCHYEIAPYYVGKVMTDVETLVEEKIKEVETGNEIIEF